MTTKWLCLVMLLVSVCQSAAVDVGQGRSTSPANGAAEEAKLDEQLQLIRDALLNKDSSEQMRINAATVMLADENPLARKILLDALKQAENSAAQVAVCKALTQAGATQKPIRDKQDFIQPLLEILTTDDAVGGKLAAEATLIFEYEQIQQSLERIATDTSQPIKARVNAIYALKLHPDIRAAIKLINLLDDSESRVAVAAERALYSLGISVGEDVEARKEIIKELEREGPEAFLRRRLIRQRYQMWQLETERDLWQKQYLTALDTIYEGKDDATKGEFLVEHLSGAEAIVKLWALEKVYQWRVKPGSIELPDAIESILVDLISDSDRDVRLKTAKLLPLMGELNSAQRLLAQLDVEQDDEVKMELFVALGYAFLPNPKTKISSEIRKQALEWAVKYLAEQDPEKAQKGAEVMKKLLKQDELTSTELDRYLGLLVDRYEQQKNSPDGNLRGELLSAMAGLCAQGSACKAKADKLFKPLFEGALRDETDLVREAAMDGLVFIDKPAALKRLRQDFVQEDPSLKIRKRLIVLAGEEGGKKDLDWLVEKIGSTSEGKLAWQAMLKIFERSDSDVLKEWKDKFFSQNSQTKVSNEQKIAFLGVAQRRATSENKPEMLKDVRQKLADLYVAIGQLERAADLYIAIGQLERAADYLGRLYEAAQTEEEKEAILPKLVDVYLRGSKVELAANLVENCLLQKDLDPNSTVVRSIDNYLSNPEGGVDPNTVLKALTAIEIEAPDARPRWREQLKRWAGRLLGNAADSKKPTDSDN